MSLQKHLLLVCISASLGITACNQAPDQYSAEPPPKINRDLSQIPTRDKLGGPTNPEGGVTGGGNELSQEEKVRRVRENSQKAITYGDGAKGSGGGISFETEYGQSKKILSKPFYGPDKDGLAAYEEKIWVYWRKDKPRTPFAIFHNPGYLGAMDIGLKDPAGKARPVHVSDELAQFFNGDPSGKKLIVQVYNHLEKKDPSYNCLETKKCQVDDSGAQFLQFKMPRAVMLFTQDDRRSLFRIILTKVEDPGFFANNADIVNGRILIPSSEGTAADSIDLGMTWGEAKAKGKADTDNTLSTRAFVKGFHGLGVIISKSSSDRDYFFPTDDEKINGYYFSDAFEHRILFGDKGLKLTKNLDGGLDVSLGCGEELEVLAQPMPVITRMVTMAASVPSIEALTANNAERDALLAELAKEKPSSCLETKLPFIKEDPKRQKDLIRKMTIEIVDQASENSLSAQDKQKLMKHKSGTLKKGDKSFAWSFSNFDAQGVDRTFEGLLTLWEPKKKSGVTYSYEISETTGNMFISLELTTNPISEITVPAKFISIQAGSGELGGFKLGNQVQLKEVDLGREEATLVVDHSGKSLETRVSYDPNGKLRLEYLDGDKLKEGDQMAEMIGTENLALGMHPVKTEGAGDSKLVTYEIDTISIGGNGKGIDNLCGLPNFTATMGMKDTKFIAQLLKAMGIAKTESAKAKAKHLQILKKKERIAEGSGETLDPIKDKLTDSEQSYFSYEGCKFDSPLDPNGSGLNVRYYFPKQRVLLSFDNTEGSGMDRELGEITIYKRPDEAATVVGGAQ